MSIKALNKQNVEKPTLPIKILQFGEGNFLRAFVDWQIDKANEAGVMNHGVAIVQPIDKGMATSFLAKPRRLLVSNMYLKPLKMQR